MKSKDLYSADPLAALASNPGQVFHQYKKPAQISEFLQYEKNWDNGQCPKY
jgi:hypothetical protein